MVVGPGFRSALVAATTAVLLAGSAAAAPAAPPAGREPPPKAGFVDAKDVVPVGWDGPLTVGWLNYDRSQTFRVVVTGAGAYSFSQDVFIAEGSSVREPVDVTAVTAAGDYSARFLDEGGNEVFGHDFRAAEPVTLTVGDAAPATFLPRVRDGIRDATHLDYSVDRRARVLGRVLDRRGRVVQVVDLGLREPGVEHRWTWSGRSRHGAVDRGRYTLRLSAAADGLEVTRARETRVASYKVPVTRKVRRLGDQTVGRAPGDCRLSPRAGRALQVDCTRADRGARVTWRFHPGRSAQGVRWLVEREGRAQVTRRRAGGALLITARVRPGSAFTVDRVWSSYRTRAQR